MKAQPILKLALVAMIALNVWLIARPFLKKTKHKGPKEEIVKRLDLDANQHESYAGLITIHRCAVQDAELKMDSLRQELFTLVAQDDRSGAAKIGAAIGALQEEMELIHFDHLMDIKSICTEQQLPKFERLAQDLKELFSRDIPTNNTGD